MNKSQAIDVLRPRFKRIVAGKWPNVTFVRNPDYAHTSNTDSLRLGSQYLDEPFIAIDGDLLIDSTSFRHFLSLCRESSRSIIGIVRRTTEDAVAVQLDHNVNVVAFTRNDNPAFAQTKDEWSGIAYLKDSRITTEHTYVFEELARDLPLPSCRIECAKIDTPRDFERAVIASASYM